MWGSWVLVVTSTARRQREQTGFPGREGSPQKRKWLVRKDKRHAFPSAYPSTFCEGNQTYLSFIKASISYCPAMCTAARNVFNREISHSNVIFLILHIQKVKQNPTPQMAKHLKSGAKDVW